MEAVSGVRIGCSVGLGVQFDFGGLLVGFVESILGWLAHPLFLPIIEPRQVLVSQVRPLGERRLGSLAYLVVIGSILLMMNSRLNRCSHYCLSLGDSSSCLGFVMCCKLHLPTGPVRLCRFPSGSLGMCDNRRSGIWLVLRLRNERALPEPGALARSAG